MSRNVPRFTQQFKNSAIQLVINNEKSVVVLAKELGVSEKTLLWWLRQYRTKQHLRGSNKHDIESQKEESNKRFIQWYKSFIFLIIFLWSIHIIIAQNSNLFEIMPPFTSGIYSEPMANILTLALAVILVFNSDKKFYFSHRGFNIAFVVFIFGLFSLSHIFVNTVIDQIKEEQYTAKFIKLDNDLTKINKRISNIEYSLETK